MVVCSQFVIQKITQMGQRFTELNRIDKGLAVSVLPVKLFQVFAPDHECRQPATFAGLNMYPAQIAAIAQKVCASKNVCGLNAPVFIHQTHLPPGKIM